MERVFEHPESGLRVTAINDVQADLFLARGFVEVEDKPKSKAKEEK